MTVPQIYTVVALCIYTALMIFIGCISYGKAKNLDSFLIGGRHIGAWATAFAYGTTYFSAVVFVGYAGQHGWNIGIGAIWIGVGNAVLGCLLSWLLFANRTRKMTKKLNARTMPDYSGLMADSPVTLPRRLLLKKSPTPLTPVVAFTSPTVHCIAPACSVMLALLRSQTTCRLRTFISLQ